MQTKILSFFTVLLLVSCKKEGKECLPVVIDNKTVTVTNVTDTSIHIQWKPAKHANSYLINVFRDGYTYSKEYTTQQTNFVIPDLNPSTNYKFSIWAKNECSEAVYDFNHIGINTSEAYLNNLLCMHFGDNNWNEIIDLVQTGDHGILTIGNESTIVKFDQHGNKVWKKKLSFQNDFYRIIPFQGKYSILGNQRIFNISEEGQIIDTWLINPPESIEMVALQYAHDGSMIFTGNIQKPVQNDDNRDFVIVKASANGSVEWSKCIGSTENDYIADICMLPDNSIIGVGYSQFYTEKLIIFRMDIQGNLSWIKKFTAPCMGSSLKIKQSSDEKLYITGNSNSGFYVLKIDDQGNCLWSKTVSETGITNITYSSFCPSQNGSLVGMISTVSRILVFKLDDNGTLLWSKALQAGDNYFKSATSICNYTNDAYIVGGYADVRRPDGEYGHNDFLLIKVADTPDFPADCNCFATAYISVSNKNPPDFTDLNVFIYEKYFSIENANFYSLVDIEGTNYVICE